MEVRAAQTIEWTCCTVHPDVALPIPLRESERFLCYRCKQAERATIYRRQRDEWEKQKLRIRSLNTRFAITEAFTIKLTDVKKRAYATPK